MFTPRDLTLRFGCGGLDGQFRLGRTGDLRLSEAGWRSFPLAGWELQYHTSLPIVPLVRRAASPGPGRESGGPVAVGCLLGYPVGPDGTWRDGTESVELPAGVEGPGAVAAWLAGWGGRYVAFVAGAAGAAGGMRVVPDPFGSMSVVHAPIAGVVASSTALIPYGADTEDDPGLIEAFGIPDRDTFFPFGLTPRRGVSRLLPNHSLDLGTWRVERNWPLGPLLPAGDAAACVDRVAEGLTRQIAAVAARQPVTIAMTAGHDSRMMLACARGCLDRLSFYTLAYDERSRLDADLARRLARLAGVEALVVPAEEPVAGDLDLWLHRTGCCIGEVRGQQTIRMYPRVPRERVQLIGLGGEIGRGFYWRDGDEPDRMPAVEVLVDRLGAPRVAPVMAAAERWLDEVKSQPSWLAILDLLYLEQRVGCWGGVWPYAYAGQTGCQFFPFCHRAIIEAMLALPWELRGSDRLSRALIEPRWPELLRWPFNRAVGWARWTGALRRRWRRCLGGTP